MPPRWGLFAGIVVLVTAAFLSLARATSSTFSDSPADEGSYSRGELEDQSVTRDRQTADPGLPTMESNPDDEGTEVERDGHDPTGRSESRLRAPSQMGTDALLVNAALSQLLVGLPLIGITWYAQVPADALGLQRPISDAILPGIGLGVGIYLVNEAGALAVEKLGFDADEGLRELLAPDSASGWALLLLVALPLIAGVEEFLFRAALIGGLAAGFDLPIWGLAVVSSVLFAIGHGLQGPGGVIVTGVLGYGLAAAFVLTGSLWVVIVAHYLVNALEFVVHEGLGIEFGKGK